ncbi:hypothetical protein ACFC6L_18045 [Kitasatospora phosalacinea]|uniref:hypothetical protein n=1 Tax=Kitasatospora phosalacinea TaxID=2065 RepID=UPI0035DF02BB
MGGASYHAVDLAVRTSVATGPAREPGRPDLGGNGLAREPGRAAPLAAIRVVRGGRSLLPRRRPGRPDFGGNGPAREPGRVAPLAAIRVGRVATVSQEVTLDCLACPTPSDRAAAVNNRFHPPGARW